MQYIHETSGFHVTKGGSFRKWFGNLEYLVNWESDGYEIRNFVDEKGKQRSRPQNMDYYFREGITWSTLSSGQLSMRYSAKGVMFETKGSECFFRDNQDLKYVLGMVNTKVAGSVLSLMCPTLDFHEGPVGRIPVINDDERQEFINKLVDESILISQGDWDSFETSWDFKKHPMI